LVRRHFFLAAALAILVLMVVAGGLKMAFGKHGGAQAPGGPSAAQGPGGGAGGGSRGGPGGGGGRRGGGGAAQVSVAAVQAKTFVDSIDVIGVAKGRQSVILSAATTQLVERVRFSDGQSVAKGAVLVELKDTEQNAGLAQAQARVVQAQRDFDRWKTLSAQGFASKTALDQREATYLAAKADVDAARARQPTGPSAPLRRAWWAFPTSRPAP
jgi:membrane fusion protein (multidrug efflux system)